MRKRAKPLAVLLCCLLTTAVLVVLIATSGASGPSYQGRTLRRWLEKYTYDRQIYPADPGDRLRSEDRQAVQAIGTNAIPYLLIWIQQDPGRPPASSFVIRHVPYRIRRSSLGRWFEERTYRGESLLAAYGFELLGSNAAPAVPELMKLASDGTRPQTAARARDALTILRREIMTPTK